MTFTVSNPFEEHLETPKLLLQFVEEGGIKLSLEKSNFAAEEVAILEHIFKFKEKGSEETTYVIPIINAS